MKYIDEKFKDMQPSETVEKIKGILQNLGIETKERWNESGIDNCWSLNLSANGGIPSSNGKGVSEEFARASAYGEFIERLQGGLFFNKFMAIDRDPEMNIQNFAPDIKYMTKQELKENGEWMDYIIETYKGSITRDTLAELCKIYACIDEDKIPTIPFYSLFEDKYVYLPMGFVDQIYGTNGCCVGNTKEEAWVHAFSEMMERNASLAVLTSGKAAPKISEEVLEKYPTVMKIINQIRSKGKFDVEIFDYSIGNGFPIMSTRIINKETQSYHVNVAADPVMEIAIQRTLTETFQGKNIHNLGARNSGKILNKLNDYPMLSNVINQLEVSGGMYTADFFANEITCTKEPANFIDNSDKTNKELLDYMLDLFKDIDKPVYVRNFSYLGFPCYRFVVPGFSEVLSLKLKEPIMEAIAYDASKTLKNIAEARDDELSWLMMHSKMMNTVFSRSCHFGRLAGLPMLGGVNTLLICISRAYAANRLKLYDEELQNIDILRKSSDIDDENKRYFSCVGQYVSLKKGGISEEKIRVIINKFFEDKYSERLYRNLDNGLTPYDEFLLKCDHNHCGDCRYKEACLYNECKAINIKVGNVYKKFVNGQDKEEFAIDRKVK